MGVSRAGFWVKVLNDFKARGIKDVFIFSIDGLNGLEKAIESVFFRMQIFRGVWCIRLGIIKVCILEYLLWKKQRRS